jgi:transcriptional regulator GlxA family with amidase domain
MPATPDPAASARTTVAIFLFDGAEELDWAGPWEVLSAWAAYTDDDVEVFTVARHDGVVTSAKGLRVLPDHSWDTAPTFDVLVYPGGRGTRRQLGDREIGSWLEQARERGSLLTSVCTGSLVFADNGLLDGRPATTHWGALDLLASLGTDLDVRPDERFVDDGDIVTAAGVSAGIDMALHLVARLSSPETAATVRRAIQYDPDPPV